MWLAWEDVPNKITAGDRHDCQIFHVDQSRQRGALVTLLLGRMLGMRPRPSQCLTARVSYTRMDASDECCCQAGSLPGQ